QALFFDHGHAQSVLRGADCRRVAAGPTADDDNVECALLDHMILNGQSTVRFLTAPQFRRRHCAASDSVQPGRERICSALTGDGEAAPARRLNRAGRRAEGTMRFGTPREIGNNVWTDASLS